MKDLVFVSVAFGEQYVEQQERLKESIKKIYPEAQILFWTDELPPGSKPMNESLYGFKVHAIEQARRIAPRVLWLDPAMILMREIDDLVNDWAIAVVKDDNKLLGTISDKALNYFGVSKEVIVDRGLHLVGGSLYYFNFEYKKTISVFETWRESERAGIFGSQYEAASEQINGHRNDESCMAIAMHLNQCFPLGADEIGYCVESNPVFIKKHFK